MSMRAFRPLAVAMLAAMVLTACVSQPAREVVPVDAAQVQANDSRRGALLDWDIGGRIAVSGAGKGGSGRIDWQQRAAAYTISLSAPVTRQSWQLSGDETGARLEGVAGGPRDGGDVEELLFSATGWSIPVRALQYWVRGVGATAGDYGPARLAYGAAGLPARLEQAGWSIDYQDWYPADSDRPQLPRRIVARNGDASVKLMIDEWSLGSQ